MYSSKVLKGPICPWFIPAAENIIRTPNRNVEGIFDTSDSSGSQTFQIILHGGPLLYRLHFRIMVSLGGQIDAMFCILSRKTNINSDTC